MDAVYLYQHSPFGDFEIRHSLRSLALHAPWIGKVYVLGDRPACISEDPSVIECIPHDSVATGVCARLPAKNFFILNYLASRIPGLSDEYLRMSDDFYLLRDVSVETARLIRHHGGAQPGAQAGPGKWRASLWRTRRRLMQLGFSAYNFETHTPAYLRRDWVAAAWAEFRAEVSEDPFAGLLGLTAILNHAFRAHAFPLTNLRSEMSRAGFYRIPPTAAALEAAIPDRLFLNHDDHAFGVQIAQFLGTSFPTPCQYEKPA